MTALRSLRTAAWYGDRELGLRCPERWNVSVFSPDTPRPLSDTQIAQTLREPVGGPPLARLAEGKHRPAVLLDDLTRPTPAHRVVPLLLAEFAEAGIPAEHVTLVLATGTHGDIPDDAVAKKAGREAAARCRTIVHDDRRGVERVGRTSFGTPVLVNREVLGADLVVGVGGVYPQHSTGFGGGSKLALGVLGRRSITHLHYGHRSMAGSYNTDNDFRRDLDEIARAIGLRFSVSLHVDAARQVVRVVAGDHESYYQDAVAFSRSAYRAPLPGDADVVIANAYPMDVSLTFMRSKGIIPLLHAKPGASRIVIAACEEGVGRHGLFPFINAPRMARQRHLARRIIVQPQAVPAKARRRVAREIRKLGRINTGSKDDLARQTSVPRHPMWLFAPAGPTLPSHIPGMEAVRNWEDVLRRVDVEQLDRSELGVVVYPCAPLQVLDLSSERDAAGIPSELGVVD